MHVVSFIVTYLTLSRVVSLPPPHLVRYSLKGPKGLLLPGLPLYSFVFLCNKREMTSQPLRCGPLTQGEPPSSCLWRRETLGSQMLNDAFQFTSTPRPSPPEASSLSSLLLSPFNLYPSIASPMLAFLASCVCTSSQFLVFYFILASFLWGVGASLLVSSQRASSFLTSASLFLAFILAYTHISAAIPFPILASIRATSVLVLFYGAVCVGALLAASLLQYTRKL